MDRVRVNQILINLLTNASRFSEENKEINITVTQLEEEVTISIQDKGIGIEKEYMVDLFQPFPRVTTSSPRGGTGLGLSICKGIIDLHGGSIEILSDGEDTGVTVNFSLPL